jgi:hypothetical protein
MVLIAAVGDRPDQFRVRKVGGWEVYDLDAVAAPRARQLDRFAPAPWGSVSLLA